MFHAMGSIQNSEAFEESTASIYKWMGRNGISTQQVHERSMLRAAGLHGEDAPHEKAFILQAWSTVFGGIKNIRFFAKDRESRAKRYPLGNGSVTLQNMRARQKKLRSLHPTTCYKFPLPTIGKCTVAAWSKERRRVQRALCS